MDHRKITQLRERARASRAYGEKVLATPDEMDALLDLALAQIEEGQESRPLSDENRIYALVSDAEGRLASAIRGLDADAMRSQIHIASAVYSALLKPPPRPEGAEEIEAILSELPDTALPITDAGRADLLASRGVRVTGAES